MKACANSWVTRPFAFAMLSSPSRSRCWRRSSPLQNCNWQVWCIPSAFADYSAGIKPFYETPKSAFLRAMDISCYSLIALSESLRGLIDPEGSVVTISISTTRMASENYGYMAPVKAALIRASVPGQVV